tara:strand:+ start:1123 stop:1974 length:852 start_codon:yes stop_codon:yes gene_type:complete
MISIIGIGNVASAITEKFQDINNYEVYLLNNKVQRNTKNQFKLKHYDTPDQYEANVPDVTAFLKNVRKRAQVFVTGASLSSNYTLGILEQIKHAEIDLFYIQPDIELLTGVPRINEKITFGVLQQYARSGLFKSITLISNSMLEQALGEVPIKTYYDTLNNTIFQMIHYLNFFEFNEPEIGVMSTPAETSRIRAIAALDIEKLEEKWFFELDRPRELCYYICINNKRLASEGGLHKKLVDQLKDKPKNAFRKLSYAIYETDHDDFGFCVAHTNVVQEQKTFDS